MLTIQAEIVAKADLVDFETKESVAASIAEIDAAGTAARSALSDTVAQAVASKQQHTQSTNPRATPIYFKRINSRPPHIRGVVKLRTLPSNSSTFIDCVYIFN